MHTNPPPCWKYSKVLLICICSCLQQVVVAAAAPLELANFRRDATLDCHSITMNWSTLAMSRAAWITATVQLAVPAQLVRLGPWAARLSSLYARPSASLAAHELPRCSSHEP